jgi:dTDP-4-dehydrorhamnose 3,5-epimerase
MPFEFQRTKIPGVVLIKPRVFEDDRGFFMETYKQSDFKEAGIDVSFVQMNHSKSTKGVIRGLHFQKEPYAQSKLVRCIKGKIFDVAVDVRKDSEYFGKYVSAELSEENKQLLFIPKGFAHGFQVLSEEAEIEYLVDNEYAPEYENGIIWNDENINVEWPIDNLIVSKKDERLIGLINFENIINFE